VIIKAITDNLGKTMDRYTVYFGDGSYLSLSFNCDSPQGVSQFGDSHNISDSEISLAAKNNGKILQDETVINFFDLPENVQKHVIRRLEN
jgi:hypothetical protein